MRKLTRREEIMRAITAATACAQAGLLDRAREWLEMATEKEARER